MTKKAAGFQHYRPRINSGIDYVPKGGIAGHPVREQCGLFLGLNHYAKLKSGGLFVHTSGNLLCHGLGQLANDPDHRQRVGLDESSGLDESTCQNTPLQNNEVLRLVSI